MCGKRTNSVGETSILKWGKRTHLLENQRRDVVGLHEFAGEHSWLVLERLTIDTDWMQFPPSDWTGCQNFVRF